MSTETVIKVGGISKEFAIKKKGGEDYIGGEDFIHRDIKSL